LNQNFEPRTEHPESGVPVLSIVIVNFNTRADLLRCLDVLHERPPITPYEILVVDNGSTDGSPAAVRARWPRVTVIEAGGNLGYARANNLGIRKASGELILLLNPDTLPRGAAIDRLVAILYAKPHVGVVGPRLVDAEARPELSFGRMISPFAEFRQKLIGRMRARGAGWATAYVERAARREHYPDWVSGACLLVRRPDAEAVGLLDERYFIYTEDVDFCAAIRKRGRAVLFTPEVEVIHLGGRAVATAPGATEAAYRRSQIAFYEKHHPGWVPALRWYLLVRGKLPHEDHGGGDRGPQH
jgi:GT2 family glycosyltransferase